MKNTLNLLFVLFSCFCFSSLSADTLPSVNYRISGRLHLDGGIFLGAPRALDNAVAIPELRLAGKISFMSDWYAQIDVGFANDKVSLKDAFVQYAKNGNYYRVGHMIGFFSLDQSTSTNDLLFNTAANSAETFYLGRRIGMSYTRSVPHYYLSAGAFCGDRLQKDPTEKAGCSFTGRALWRWADGGQKLIHIGVGALLKVPNQDKETGNKQLLFHNTGVTYLPVPQLTYLKIDHVANQKQGNIEALHFSKRWLVQSEYFITQVQRTGGVKNYLAQGGYIQGGFLVKGSRFGYDALDALPMMPSDPHSVLLVCRYNCTNLNDYSSDLLGGIQQDLSVGLNYYFNKYCSSRLNYSYLWLDKYAAAGKCNFSMIQARIQVCF